LKESSRQKGGEWVAKGRNAYRFSGPKADEGWRERVRLSSWRGGDGWAYNLEC
jgi:hypothetical protein